MPDSKILNIINKADEVIGEASREEIHQEGLLHREIHVWFFTPTREIIFQHRAKDKDTYPDMLDATVGGHVEIGASYEETALKETAEETGIKLDLAKLKFIQKMPRRTVDEATRLINNTIRVQYAYLFDGDINDLRPEAGKILEFQKRPVTDLANLSEAEKKKFIPLVLSKEFLDMFERAQRLLGLI